MFFLCHTFTDTKSQYASLGTAESHSPKTYLTLSLALQKSRSGIVKEGELALVVAATSSHQIVRAFSYTSLVGADRKS